MAELTDKDEIRETVRERYAAAASSVGEGGVACCGPSEAAGGSCGCGTDVPDACGGETFGAGLYEIGDHDSLPDAAKLASLGCGNPTLSPSCARARPSSTLARAAGSTSSFPPGESGRRARPMGST